MKSDAKVIHSPWAMRVLTVVLVGLFFALGRYYFGQMGNTVAALPSGSVADAQRFPVQNKLRHPAAASPATLAQAKTDLARILQLPGKYNREKALLALAAGLDAETLKAILPDLELHSSIGNNKQAIAILAAQWAETDPQGALDSLKLIHDPHDLFVQGNLATGIFAAWSAKDPAAAMAALSQLPAGYGRDGPLAAIIENMMGQDPQAALSAFAHQHLENFSGSLYQDMFRESANLNPTATAAVALTLPPGLAHDSALIGVASAWAAQDPASALAWAQTLPASQAKSNAINAVIETQSEQDPVSAAQYATQLPNGPNRDNLLEQIAANWAQTDPNGLLIWAKGNLTGGNYAQAAQTALDQIGQADPAAAAAALAQIADPLVAIPAIEQLAKNWVGQDPQAALAWAQSLPAENASARNSAISAVLQAWSTTDPASAATSIQTLVADPAFGPLANTVIDNWENSDPQAALAWAQSLPAGKLQSSAVLDALAELAKFDPQSAWATAEQLSGSNQSKALSQVISSWAHQQPTQAAAALQNLPAGKNLDAATADVAASWLNQDPTAASQWINTLPQGSARDGAVTQIITTVGINDPAAAFNWVATLSNETLRNAQAVKLLGQWANQNPAAAATAAQNALGNLTNLSPAQQAALQKVVDKADKP